MTRGPKPVALDLTEAERGALAAMVRRHKTGQVAAQRARIVLACAEPGATNMGVARSLGVSRPSVMTWRKRFAQHGLQGLGDAPRPGALRKVAAVSIGFQHWL